MITMDTVPSVIAQSLHALLEPDQIVELRILNSKTGTSRYTENLTGYFDTDHIEEAAQAVAGVASATGFYWTLNPVKPALHARAYNRIKKAEKGGSTGDHEIIYRRWLLIDLDPCRPAGISATDAEKATSKIMAQQVRDYLKERAWPNPVVIDSGNGFHLLYRIQLPSDDAGLVERVLKALDKRFSDTFVKIDVTNSNASRISKLPGTPACKGDSTPSRPHRMSKLVQVPEVLEVVPTVLLEELAGPVEAKGDTKATIGSTFDLPAFMSAHFPDATGPDPWESKAGTGRIWVFKSCPWRDGDGTSASIRQHPNGAISASCQHDNCPGSKTTGNHWRELRERFDPPSDNNGGTWPDDPQEPLLQEWVHPTLPLPPSLPRIITYGAGEFLDRPIPEAQWLIPGLIPLGVPTVLASKGGIGKSFLSLQMCIALAAGKPFLSFEALPPMGAVYFGLEDDKDTYHRRLRSIVDHYKACDDWTHENDFNLRRNMVTPFVNWQFPGATAYLPTLATDLESTLNDLTQKGVKPGVLVVDTLSRVSEGDENTVQALRPVLNACHSLASYRYTPLVLHHVGKGQDGSRTPGTKKPMLTDRMSTDWVRGSSAIVDNFRCVLQFALILEDEAEGAGLDTEKARMGGYLVFGTTKLNGGQKADWIFLEQDDHGRWFAPLDGVETLARIRGGKAVLALSKQIALLVDIYQVTRFGAEPDRILLGQKHCADAKDPKAALRSVIQKLRNAGLIQKNSHALTLLGLQRVQSIGLDTVRLTNDDN